MNNIDTYAYSICEAFNKANGFQRPFSVEEYLEIRKTAADEILHGFGREYKSGAVEKSQPEKTVKKKPVSTADLKKTPKKEQSYIQPVRQMADKKSETTEKRNAFDLLRAIPDNWN